MKRWIHASTQNDVFNTQTTNTSYYDEFLTDKGLAYMQKAKNLTGHIEYMSPQEYFEECASKIFQGRHSADQLKEQRSYSHNHNHERLVDNYREAMRKGDQFPLCYLNYAHLGQEGLHRMYAVGELYGWDKKYPVLVVEPYDRALWEEQNRREEISDYCKGVLKDVIKDADDEISDWNNPVPDNFKESFEDLIEKKAAHNEEDPKNIKVTVKVENKAVFVFLVEYEGQEVESSSYVEKLWLDDMFRTEDSKDIDYDEAELDDIDSYLFDSDDTDII